MSKILFITEKVSFISQGIVNQLKAQHFDVITVKPDVTAISNQLKESSPSGEGDAVDPEVAALLAQEGMERRLRCGAGHTAVQPRPLTAHPRPAEGKKSGFLVASGTPICYHTQLYGKVAFPDAKSGRERTRKGDIYSENGHRTDGRRICGGGVRGADDAGGWRCRGGEAAPDDNLQHLQRLARE